MHNYVKTSQCNTRMMWYILFTFKVLLKYRSIENKFWWWPF